jgi:aldo/keto reductase family protein
MPMVGFGTWQLGGRRGCEATRYALDIGYRQIDTATMYRDEHEVGQAIRDSGLDRGEVLVTTKLQPSNAGRALHPRRTPARSRRPRHPGLPTSCPAKLAHRIHDPRLVRAGRREHLLPPPHCRPHSSRKCCSIRNEDLHMQHLRLIGPPVVREPGSWTESAFTRC